MLERRIIDWFHCTVFSGSLELTVNFWGFFLFFVYEITCSKKIINLVKCVDHAALSLLCEKYLIELLFNEWLVLNKTESNVPNPSLLILVQV